MRTYVFMRECAGRFAEICQHVCGDSSSYQGKITTAEIALVSKQSAQKEQLTAS